MFEQVGTRNTRLITEAIIQARRSHEEWHPEDNLVSRWKVLNAFKEAAPALEIKRSLVLLLDYLVSKTCPVDWDGQSEINGKSRIMVWPSNSHLADVLGISERYLGTLLRRGRELGLFEMVYSADGKRFGQRGKDNRPLFAYGFDLSPLAARYQEFQKIVDDRKKVFQETKLLRNDIMTTRKEMRSLLRVARNNGFKGDWDNIEEKARRITVLRDKSEGLEQLRRVLFLLSEMKDSLKKMVIALLSAQPFEESKKNEDVFDTKCTTADDQMILSHIDTRKHLYVKDVSLVVKNEETNVLQTQKPLRNLVVTSKHVIQIAPIFREFVQDKKSLLWDDVINAANNVRSILKISPSAWKDACTTLGTTEAVAAIAIIAARYEKKEIYSPGGTLRRMIQLNHTNELRLDLSFYKLLKESKKATKPIVTINVTSSPAKNYNTDQKSQQKEIVNTQPFPNSGGIDYNKYWMTVKRETHCNMDNTMIADKFRSFCKKRNIQLNSKNIKQIFKNFCKIISTI